MEPRAAVAEYDATDQRYTLHAGSGGAVRLEDDLATVLNGPATQVRAVMRDIVALLSGDGRDFSGVRYDMSQLPDFNRRVYAVAVGIPAMSSCASTPTLPGIVGEYMFSNYTGDNLQAAALVDYAMKQGYKNAFIMLSKDTPYTQKLPEYFGQAFQKKGGTVAGTIEY